MIKFDFTSHVIIVSARQHAIARYMLSTVRLSHGDLHGLSVGLSHGWISQGRLN